MSKTIKTFEAKQSIIVGLYNARADEELIVIADVERTRSPRLRNEVIQRLRLLQTPRRSSTSSGCRYRIRPKSGNIRKRLRFREPALRALPLQMRQRRELPPSR